MGIDVIIEQLDELIPLGLSSVLLFPVLDGADNLKVKIKEEIVLKCPIKLVV